MRTDVEEIGLWPCWGCCSWLQEAMAQVFPVDAATTTTITSVKGDIVAWGVVFIGVALTIFAYKRVKSLVH